MCGTWGEALVGADLAALVAQLGVGPYRDGSSALPGTLYQPMGDFVPALAGVPCHKPEAVRDDYRAVYEAGEPWAQEVVLDLGCATGYYGQLPCAAYVGLEADPAAAAVAQALGFAVQAEAVTPATLALALERWRPSTVLLLNLPMWLQRQRVLDDVLGVLGVLSARVFFQTAGLASGGMWVDDRLGTRDDEWAYLRAYFGVVDFVRTTRMHGGERHLWRCGPS